MFAILTATACSGVLASKVLLELGVSSLPIRYPLAVLLAYLVFFLCVRLWLIYVTPPKKGGGSHLTDWLDFPDFSAPGSPAGVRVPILRPGGGQFGGAGASASFDASTAIPSDLHSAVGKAASGAADGLGDAVGEAAGALGEEGGFIIVVVVAVLLVLLATILGATVYVVYEAPVILSEAAFETLLAASLIRKAKKMGNGDWVGSIFSTTWKPFLITLVMALVAGGILKYYFPGAIRVAEILSEVATSR
jgi:hypothetical protein